MSQPRAALVPVLYSKTHSIHLVHAMGNHNSGSLVGFKTICGITISDPAEWKEGTTWLSDCNVCNRKTGLIEKDMIVCSRIKHRKVGKVVMILPPRIPNLTVKYRHQYTDESWAAIEKSYRVCVVKFLGQKKVAEYFDRDLYPVALVKDPIERKLDELNQLEEEAQKL